MGAEPDVTGRPLAGAALGSALWAVSVLVVTGGDRGAAKVEPRAPHDGEPSRAGAGATVSTGTMPKRRSEMSKVHQLGSCQEGFAPIDLGAIQPR